MKQGLMVKHSVRLRSKAHLDTVLKACAAAVFSLAPSDGEREKMGYLTRFENTVRMRTIWTAPEKNWQDEACGEFGSVA